MAAQGEELCGCFSYTLYNHNGETAPQGYIEHYFTTARDYPNEGPLFIDNTWYEHGNKYGLGINVNSDPRWIDLPKSTTNDKCSFLWYGPENHRLFLSYHNPAFTALYPNGWHTLPQNSCSPYDNGFGCFSVYLPPIDDMSVVPPDHPSYSLRFYDCGHYSGCTDPEWNDPDKKLLSQYMRVGHIQNNPCCVDANSNNVCDILEIPYEERSSGGWDRDAYRGHNKKTTYYDSDYIVIKKIENEYDFEPQTFYRQGLIKTVWPQHKKQTIVENGQKMVYEYEYGDLIEKPVQKREIGDDQTIITSYFYAYQWYPSMKEQNMLIQPYMQRKYIDSTDNTPFYSTRTTWTNTFGSSYQWYPYIKYEGVNQNNEEVIIEKYISYDFYGNLLVSRDALDYTRWNYYGNDNECGIPSNPEGVGNYYKHSVVTCIEDSKSHKTKYSYNSDFSLSEEVNENGFSTSYVYDGLGRIKHIG